VQPGLEESVPIAAHTLQRPQGALSLQVAVLLRKNGAILGNDVEKIYARDLNGFG